MMDTGNPNSDTVKFKFDAVTKYVEKQRSELEISVLSNTELPELSEIAVGESRYIEQFLDRQLVNTGPDASQWRQLKSQILLDEIYHLICTRNQ